MDKALCVALDSCGSALVCSRIPGSVERKDTGRAQEPEATGQVRAASYPPAVTC